MGTSVAAPMPRESQLTISRWTREGWRMRRAREEQFVTAFRGSVDATVPWSSSVVPW